MPETVQRRVIGRILSLGFPLPGVRVDNYNFLSAPAFFDYDALVVDPSTLSTLIEGIVDCTAEAATFSGKPVRNLVPAPDEAGLADVLMRRTDEVRALLERGGVVVCFAHPAAAHRGVLGIDELRDDYWLGEIAPPLVAGEGTEVHVTDYAHPLAAFLHSQSSNVQYRAHVDVEGIAKFASGGAIFVRSYGGGAIGVELPVKKGRLVMVPALKAIPSGDARYMMSESLQAGIRRMLGVMAEGRAPYWVEQVEVPGLTARSAELSDAQNDLAKSQRGVTAAESSHEELAKYQRLLWQEGALGLEPAVLDALRLVGFDVYDRDASALELRADDARVLLEIDASDDAVALGPHFRLRQRIEAAIERRGEAPRALLLINGHRHKAPAERGPQASDALRTAAETMQYAVGTTTSLFDAVVAVLGGDANAAAAYRARVTSETGLLS